MGLNSMGVLQWGTEEQKQRFLTPQAEGTKIAAFGLTEPGAGSDVAAIRSTARRDGDTTLSTARRCGSAWLPKADHVLWFAKTDPHADPPHDGITAFMVETSMPGVTSGDIHGKLGVRAGSTGWVNCENVRVPLLTALAKKVRGSASP
jgi:glutaryl-CoA dehydrogenase (non-decarboxylating)